MLLYDNFTIMLRYSEKLSFSQFVRDYQNKPTSGSFYEEEIEKVKNPDIYLIEKVLKKRGNELYVKWLGFNKSHNSWINKNNV